MKLILGDNPFFGVNHLSQEKAAKYLEQKGDFSTASGVVRCAYELGIRRLMVSNHVDLPDLLKKIKVDESEVLDAMKIALVVPYAQKFNQLVGSRGVAGVVTRLPLFKGALSSIRALWSSIVSSNVDIEGFIELLIESELSNIRHFQSRVDTLCLHNIVTDLCLGLNKANFVAQFCNVVRRLNMRPVVITQNPLAFDAILERDVVLCFSYNQRGYMVNPSLDEVRKGLTFRREYWAMSLLASGAISLDEALSDPFLTKFGGIIYATGSRSRAASSIPKILSVFG